MRVIRALHAAQLVSEAALSDFASDAQGSKVSPHRPPQVVEREVRNTVLNPRESGVQGVNSDV
jgi:hypothetical protein